MSPRSWIDGVVRAQNRASNLCQSFAPFTLTRQLCRRIASISPHVRPFFSFCCPSDPLWHVRTLTNTTHAWCFTGQGKGRTGLLEGRTKRTGLCQNGAAAQQAGSVGGQTSPSVKLYTAPQTPLSLCLRPAGEKNTTQYTFEHKLRLTCESCLTVDGRVTGLSWLDIQTPLSCLSWSRSRLPENMLPIKPLHHSYSRDVMSRRPMALEVQPPLSEWTRYTLPVQCSIFYHTHPFTSMG